MAQKRFILLLKIAVSVALVAFIVFQIDIDAAFARASNIDPRFVAAAACLVVAQVLLNAVRWLTVLRPLGGKLSYPKAVRIYFVGFFFDQIFPSAIGGDAMRIYLARRAGQPTDLAINSVLLERMVILVGLILMMLTIQPVLLDVLPSPARELQATVLIGLISLCVAIFLALANLDRIPTFRRFAWITDWMHRAAEHTQFYIRHPLRLCPALGMAILCHLNNAAIIYALNLALGLELSFFQTLYLFLPIMLVTILPISIAGWGVREGAMIALYGVAGVPAASALAVSVVFGILLIAMSMPYGVLWIILSRHMPDPDTAGRLPEK